MIEDIAQELQEAVERLEAVGEGDNFCASIMRSCAERASRGSTFAVSTSRHILKSLIDPMPIDGRNLLEYERDAARKRLGASAAVGLAYHLADDAVRHAVRELGAL